MPVVAGPEPRRLAAEMEVLNIAVWKSKFYGAFAASTSPPSTRRLDGVAMLVPHRSTEPARPDPAHWLISTQGLAEAARRAGHERRPSLDVLRRV